MEYTRKQEEVMAWQVSDNPPPWISELETKNQINLKTKYAHTGRHITPMESGDYVVKHKDGSLSVFTEHQFNSCFQKKEKSV